MLIEFVIDEYEQMMAIQTFLHLTSLYLVLKSVHVGVVKLIEVFSIDFIPSGVTSRILTR